MTATVTHVVFAGDATLPSGDRWEVNTSDGQRKRCFTKLGALRWCAAFGYTVR